MWLALPFRFEHLAKNSYQLIVLTPALALLQVQINYKSQILVSVCMHT